MPPLVYNSHQLIYLPSLFLPDVELQRECRLFLQRGHANRDCWIEDAQELADEMQHAGVYYTRMWIMGHGGTASDIIANTAGDQTYTPEQLAAELHQGGLSHHLPELLVWSCYGGKPQGFAMKLRVALIALNPNYSNIAVLGFGGITGTIQPGGGISILPGAGLGFSQGSHERATFNTTVNVENLNRYPPNRRARRNSVG